MMMKDLKLAIAAACAASAMMMAAPTMAQQAVMKECGAKWQAAKAANTTGKTTWPQFLAKCRTDSAAKPAATPAAATTAAKPAAKTAAKPAAAAPAAGGAVYPNKVDAKYKALPEGQQRMKTCVDQYNANKTKGTGNANMKWIEKGGGYWSGCNKALKG